MGSGESGKLPLEFVGFGKLAWLTSKLNSSAVSENLVLRRSSKMTLGTIGVTLGCLLVRFEKGQGFCGDLCS